MPDQQAHAVLDIRVTNLEKVVERVSVAVESIDDSLKTLTRLDVKHDETRTGLGRAFTMLEDHEERVRQIEGEMPTVKQARSWIFSSAMGVVGMVGMAVVYLVLK